ncbi:MAG: transcriptional regulator, GntR family [Conexibacter sp.]|nr:transcriptional regulator, GntR family [Conexibacter sp.]
MTVPLRAPTSLTGIPINPQHVDVVYARLRDAILRGDLRPGEEVRQERMAADLQVSRTPLREALRMLAREGLVQAGRQRSYRVADSTLLDLEQLYVARLPLEATAVRIAVPKMDTEDIAELEGLMAQMATFAAAEDYEGWEVPHRAFHRRLVLRAGARVARLLGDLSDHAERYRRFYTVEGPRAWSTGVDEHRGILDACASADADAAAARVARHLARTAESVVAMSQPGYEPRDLRMALAIAVAAVQEPA